MVVSSSPDFFDLASSKLDWIADRSRILAGNVANADTPGFKTKDAAPFASALASAPFRIGLASTEGKDLPAPTGSIGMVEEDAPGEAAPDGNDVSLDQQMRLLAANDQDQNLVTTLYRRYASMQGLALGVGG